MANNIEQLKISLAEKEIEILKREAEIIKLNIAIAERDDMVKNNFQGYSFTGKCNNKQSVHYGKTGTECAIDILSGTGGSCAAWDLNQLLGWCKSSSSGVIVHHPVN